MQIISELMIGFALLIIWFLVLTLPVGVFIFILLIEETKDRNKFMLVEYFYFSVIVVLIYLAFISDLLLVFHSLNLVNYLFSVTICYMSYFLVVYVTYGKRLMIKSKFGYLLKTLSSSTLQLLIRFKENRYHYLGLLAIIIYSIISRLPGPLSISGVLASDPWTIMGLGNYIKYLGYIPEEFIYNIGVGYEALLGLMFTCGLDPLFITKFMQPVIIQPLITITVLLFLKKLKLRNRYTVLGVLLFLLAPQLKMEGEIYHPRNLGYLLAFASIYIITFYRKYRFASLLLGIIVGGIWLYHPPTAIPIILLLLIYFSIKLGKGIIKHSCTSELKSLIEILLMAFFVISPVFTRAIMLFVTETRFYEVSIVSYVAATVKNETSDWFTLIENTFKIMEFYTSGGLTTFIFAFLALLLNLKLKKYSVNFISLYFLILLFLGFNPYTRYIWGCYDRYRFFVPFAFPEAVLASVFMQYLHQYKIKLRFENQDTHAEKKREQDLSTILRSICILLFVSVVISSALLSYQSVFCREVHADDEDLLEAINFIKEHSNINSKILTYPPARDVKGDIYEIAFGLLSPRIIIGDEILLMAPQNIYDFMKTEGIEYALLLKQDQSVKGLVEAGFKLQEFGNYLVISIR